MALLTEEKANIVKKFKRNEGDTGSPKVQVALLTENINKLQIILNIITKIIIPEWSYKNG